MWRLNGYNAEQPILGEMLSIIYLKILRQNNLLVFVPNEIYGVTIKSDWKFLQNIVDSVTE